MSSGYALEISQGLSNLRSKWLMMGPLSLSLSLSLYIYIYYQIYWVNSPMDLTLCTNPPSSQLPTAIVASIAWLLGRRCIFRIM